MEEALCFVKADGHTCVLPLTHGGAHVCDGHPGLGDVLWVVHPDTGISHAWVAGKPLPSVAKEILDMCWNREGQYINAGAIMPSDDTESEIWDA